MTRNKDCALKRNKSSCLLFTAKKIEHPGRRVNKGKQRGVVTKTRWRYNICIQAFNQHFRDEQDVTQGQCLNRVELS